ncbi:MAG: chromosomal replication initiator protein DnaA [Chloroflexi bacterium]|nr:chromosomal replication initiator protein DnaA [Chloroflexota bacterium]
MTSPQDAWDTAYHQLELQLDGGKFDTWVRDARFLRYEDGQFVIGVRNGFSRDMLQHRLYRNVARVLSDAWGQSAAIRFEIYSLGGTASATDDSDLPLFQVLNEMQAASTEMFRVEPLPETSMADRVVPQAYAPLSESELNPRHTFDRFVVGGSNRLAYEALQAVVEAPGRNYNPVFVYGGVGVGKTHLLHAAAHICRKAGKRVIYVPSEAFTNDLVNALRTRTTAMLRDKYRSVDVLIVDDVQFLAGKESTQEEFFHTFNVLHAAGKQVILASDRPPRDLTALEDRLRSRFSGGLVTDISPLELETRMAIVKMWQLEQHIRLSDPVVQMIAECAASARELEGAFNMIAARVRLSHQPMTADAAARILHRLETPRNHVRTVTMADILNAVAETFSVPVDEITGKGRTSRVSLARQVVMLLARELTELSLVQVGDYLGGRQHSTIIAGIQKMSQLLAEDADLSALMDDTRRRLL